MLIADFCLPLHPVLGFPRPTAFSQPGTGINIE
jgi:hypothetical protein